MAEPNPPNKPPISEARRRANQNNAQLSTGPRTEKGKNVSKFNNLRSGCYAEELILPGESAEELQERRDRWVKDLGAKTEPERYEAFNAVHATWRQDRMRRAETIALTAMIDTVTEKFHEQTELETRDLVDRLAESPFEVVTALRNTTAGLTWMLGQVERLEQWLTVSYSFSPSDRNRAIHLCGKRPVDWYEDAAVWHWVWLNLGASKPDDMAPRDWAMQALAEDRPPHLSDVSFETRMEVLSRNLPPYLAAHAQLQQKLAALREELTERHELIALREERDLSRAIEKAKGDAGPESAQRQRVENSMDRQRRGSLKELRALQKTRPEPDDDDSDGTPREPDPGTDPDTAPTAPAPAPAPNHNGSEPIEPVVSTVTNGSVGTTGAVAVVEAPAAPVNTPATDTPEESHTPEKWGDEPTCQNGSREEQAGRAGDSVALTGPSDGPSEATAHDSAATKTLSPWERGCAASALTRPGGSDSVWPCDDPHPPFGHPLPGGEGLAALTRPSATFSQGEDDLGPDVPADPELAAIYREIEATRQARRLRDEERKERQERQDRETRQQREEQARRIDACFGLNGDRPDPAPAGDDPVPGGQAGRPPPPLESGTASG
jgi:hypothetical protein